MMRSARIMLVWATLTALTAVLVPVTIPGALGYQALTVKSGSMEPTLGTGDVVLDAAIAPGEVRIGDIVTFTNPDDPSQLITHRVRDRQANGDQVEFVTRGDANDASEEWSVSADGELGLVRYKIPGLGIVLDRMRDPWARLLLVVIPALTLGAIELWQIWRPARKEATDVQRA